MNDADDQLAGTILRIVQSSRSTGAVVATVEEVLLARGPSGAVAACLGVVLSVDGTRRPTAQSWSHTFDAVVLAQGERLVGRQVKADVFGGALVPDYLIVEA